MTPSQDTGVERCGFVAVIGAPNAGKSTLINRLAGSKVAIVSRKVQTTRTRLRAIYIEGTSQVVIVDTPGIFKPRRMLDEAMVEAAWSGAGDADLVVLLADARKGLDTETEAIIGGLQAANIEPILAINKIDLVAREDLLPLAKRFNDRYAFSKTFLLNCLSGDGVDDLRQFLAAAVPQGPWLYPADQVADLPLRFLAAEIVREQIYERLHQELPYASTVETESWKEQPDGSVRIEQVIYVERESQRKIVLGAAGQTIKLIGQTARRELEQMFGRKVHLFLFVKVRERWAEDPERLRAMGLEPPSRKAK